ncbi:hypothetical protein CL6EHI_012970 [Entamoeba histolytica]|uniref:Tetraspanin family protein n=2 Tax=Entamoeba histolytica TaxID=5759 RepID=A0A175JIR6_ENTHI|nr:hypothetical protein CL6EHI_012970 [Entamoeba histolytica]
MKDLYPHLMIYLFIAVGVFIISSLLVIGSSIFAFVTQPKYYLLDGSSLLKIREFFFISAMTGSVIMLVVVSILLCLYPIKKIRYIYALIFLIGCIFFVAIFLSSFAAFREPKKIKTLSSDEKIFNENKNSCCFKDSSLNSCGCPKQNKFECPVCVEDINDIPFFIAFLSNAICSCTLFSGIYLSCLYYYKKIKNGAEKHNISKTQYFKIKFTQYFSKKVSVEQQTLI